MPIYKFTLKAGQNLFQPIGGDFLQYIDGTAPIRIRKSGGSFNEYWIGTGTGRAAFTSFEVENPSANEITVYLWVDYEEFIDRRRNQIEAPTEFAPVQDVAGVYVGGVLAAGAALDLYGAAPAGRVRRKAVQVANLDPAVNLLLQDITSRTGFVVRPGESIALPVSGFLRVKNGAGAAVSCAVSELWWLP